jgi:hypothetical protein
MPDLAVLVPSRGRPANVARLIEACAKTCRADTLLHFGFDEDDDTLGANLTAADGMLATVRPRMGLAHWTNCLSAMNEHIPWQASIGDDMVPLTDGWDERLCEAAGPTGMAYPNDRRRSDIPEAIVVSTSLVRALGWFCEPSLHHWYVDAVWADLGRAAGCLRYLSDVVVEHRHPNVRGSGARNDATYNDAAAGFSRDLAAYQKWRMKRMRTDIETVRECLNNPS